MDSTFRILDDSPNIAPANSDIAGKFAKEIKSFCEFIGLPLAENCPAKEKSFEMETRGTVFGIGFDSVNMTWFLSDHKANKIIRRCLDAANSGHTDLKQIQKLMGSVNDFCHMCPMLRFHKSNGNQLLARFLGNEN